ncbi:MAG: hypothetical protein CMH57_01845 [Myxococcales bacterium]|nr:hypothetical protein [Myxococcales bacterium]
MADDTSGAGGEPADDEREARLAKARRKTPWWNQPWARQGGLALIVVVGLGLLGLRGWDYLRWKESQGWVATSGEVTRIARPRPTAGKKMPTSGFGGPRTAEAKWATYFYTYEAGGEARTSSKVSYAIGGDSVPLEWMSELPKKGPATVYVSPTDPTLSVLRVGDRFEFWNLRMAIALFMVVGGAVRLGYTRAGY